MIYKDIEWSQPDNPSQMGSCLIIGGSLQDIIAPHYAYNKLVRYFLSTTVLMPESVKKFVGSKNKDIVFINSNPSGSFSLKSIDIVHSYLSEARIAIICGSIGKNSETAILMERIVNYDTLKVICGDSLELFKINTKSLLNNESNILVGDFRQIRTILNNGQVKTVHLYKDSLFETVNKLKISTNGIKAFFVLITDNYIFIAQDGKVKFFKKNKVNKDMNLEIACLTCEWSVNNKDRLFEAIQVAISKIIT